MEKQKITLEPGVRYRGSAWVNEFGELHFQPEQKGSRPSNMRVVYQEANTTIYESRNNYRVSVQFEKSNKMFDKILQGFSDATTVLIRYFGKR